MFLFNHALIFMWFLKSNKLTFCFSIRVNQLCKWKSSRLPISEPWQFILLMYSRVIICILEVSAINTVFVHTVYSRDNHNQNTELSLMVIQYPGRHTYIQGCTTLQPVNWATRKVSQDRLHLIRHTELQCKLSESCGSSLLFKPFDTDQLTKRIIPSYFIYMEHQKKKKQHATECAQCPW